MTELNVYSRFFKCLILAFGLAVCSTVMAQGLANKPIKLVVPFGPGGAGDITGRAFGQYLEAIAKQPVVIENKAGANGILGTDFVKNSPADGLTLLLTTNTTLAANLSLYKKVPYDPQKDFDHIGMFGSAASVALVLKGSGINSIADLVSYAKANPGKVFYGHYNSASQMTAELFRLKTGAPLTGVPYKAISSALQDFYGKQLQVLFMEYLPALAQIEGGKVTPLGVTAPVRYKAWPQVPTIAESYPGYELGFFLGLATPTGTPPDTMKKLEGWMTAALKDEAFQARLNQLGLEPSKLARPEYNRFIGTEITRWTQIIREAGIQPE